MPEREDRAHNIVKRIHRKGGDAVAAVKAVFDAFKDKSLAARAARSQYPAPHIGRALLTLWPEPAYAVPYHYDCCW